MRNVWMLVVVAVAACGGREPDYVQDPALAELCAQACPSADRRWLTEENERDVWCNCACNRSVYKIAFLVDDMLATGTNLSEAIWESFEKQYCSPGG